MTSIGCLKQALTSSAEELALRKPDFYSVYDIDVQTDMEATGIDTLLNSVSFKNGKSISYDSLLVATGGRSGSYLNVFILCRV